MKLTLYSTPTCHYCKKAKELFNSKCIKYTEVDVLADLETREQIENILQVKL